MTRAKSSRLPKPGKRKPAAVQTYRTKRRGPGILRPLLRLLAVVLVVVGVTAAGSQLWQNDVHGKSYRYVKDEFLAWTAEGGFTAKAVDYRGLRRSDEAAVLNALQIFRGEPILTFDPHAAQQRLLALPWIESVEVRRQLPDRIVLKIVEREPAALWQAAGSWAVLDTQGRVIPTANPAKFPELPRLVGIGAPMHLDEIIALVKSEPLLADSLIAAVRVSKRRWNLRVTPGIDVRLPEKDWISAWKGLARLESGVSLFNRDVNVIDLRRHDRILFRLNPDAVIEPPIVGKET